MVDRRSLAIGVLAVLVAMSGVTAWGQAPAAQAPGGSGCRRAGPRGPGSGSGRVAEAVEGQRLRPPLEPKT